MRIKEAKLKVGRFKQFLTEQQKSKSTIKTYIRGVTLFFLFIEEKGIQSLSDRALLDFKEYIINSFSSASSNTYIVGFNAFLTYIKHGSMRLKCIKRQSKDYVPHPLTECGVMSRVNEIKKSPRLLNESGGICMGLYSFLIHLCFYRLCE
ncbi:MAG: phage integrase N-terminal SAM-like domain-containing protein [Oscillospiraceae bacterium]|jgi:site-specific recombinase XerD|nr:phage integrase N-terminal SAM-like domain-containing protein [Oscillospiraceae bacterium]